MSDAFDPTDILFTDRKHSASNERQTIADCLAHRLRIYTGADGLPFLWLTTPHSGRAAIMMCFLAARAMYLTGRRVRSDVTVRELEEWLSAVAWARSSIRVYLGKLSTNRYVQQVTAGVYRLNHTKLADTVALIERFVPEQRRLATGSGEADHDAR